MNIKKQETQSYQHLSERDEFLIGRILDYQSSLISRRWQFLATGVFINGILYSANNKPIDIPHFKLLLPINGIIFAVLLLQFVSVIAERLDKTQIRLIKDHNTCIHYMTLEEKFRIKTCRVLIYLSIISLTLGWFFLLFTENKIIFSIALLLFVSSLFTIRWKSNLDYLSKDSVIAIKKGVKTMLGEETLK